MIDNDKKENNQEKKEIDNLFFNFIKGSKKISQSKYEEILHNKKQLTCYSNYIDIIIMSYLNDIINKKKVILNNKKNLRNILYIIKIFKKNKANYKYKQFKNSFKELLHLFFITFSFNMLKHDYIFKNNIASKTKNILKIMNILLEYFLDICGKLYIDKNIEDESFELLLKFLILLSITKSVNKELNERDELINYKYFNSCISLIKIVFNNLFELQKEYTENQEKIINNIILFINDTILDYIDKPDKISYINKVYLMNNDYKTSLLIDLYFIISKTKCKDITNNFINLLVNIYIFSFKYKNIMRPMAKQLNQLFININKKTVKQINDELNLSDFSLLFIDSLINKEKEILKKKTCFIKQGFYFGSEVSGLVCDFKSIENEFTILFGFRLESIELEEITLFQILNYKDKTSLIKFYLRKTQNTNSYEMFAGDKKDSEHKLRIYINHGTNYIMTIYFKVGGLVQNTIIKTIYVKDDDRKNKKEYDVEIKNGMELKIKNFKSDNISIVFGCDFDFMEDDKIINKFRGFIGDIIIINRKNIKNTGIFSKDDELSKILLSFEGNYRDVLTILGEYYDYIFIGDNNNNNPKMYELREKIKNCYENENKMFDTIKSIISSNAFQLIEYRDEIQYNNKIKNDNYNEENNKIAIKKKYIDLKVKSDILEDNKKIKLYTSNFDKYFHIFKNELTLKQFINCGGIDYLSLLMEYYYQILTHLYTIKNESNENEIKLICKRINQKLTKILSFFYKNIIRNNIDLDNDHINKFFYQTTITLKTFMDLDILNKDIIDCLFDISNYLFSLEDNINNIESIKIDLFHFILNPKLYQKTDELQLEKLSFIMQYLLNIIKTNSFTESLFMQKIYNIETLNKLLLYTWLFDNNEPFINNNKNNNNTNTNNIIKDEKLNNNKLLIKTRYCYSSLLVEFLRFYNPKKTIKAFSVKNIIQITDDYLLEEKKTSNNINPKKDKEEDMYIFKYFFDTALEYMNKNYSIFYNMLSILVNTKLMEYIDESRIDTIKSIILKELKNKHEKKDDYKKTVYISCIQILISFYFVDDKYNRNKEKRMRNQQNFNLFIRSLNLDATLDFLYVLIFSIKQIKYLSNNFADNESYEKEIESNVNKDKDENNEYNCPLVENDLINLNEFQVNIIKNILEDIVFILYYRIELKKNDNEKNEFRLIDSFNSNKSTEPNLEKEIIDILLKIIDIIYKMSGTIIYQEIFSSDSEICAELFYLKWKSQDTNEISQNTIEHKIINYHKTLLKNHTNPFVFKFYLFILNQSIEPNNDGERITKTKLSISRLIINTLNDFQKNLDIKNENYIYYIYNLLNYLIILNEELDNNSNLFKNKQFHEIVYKYISLLDKSCLLYSNYYIEFEEKCGKIFAEIIYDLFFALFENTFNKKEFIKVFTKLSSEQDEYSLFYLIDIYKEKNLDKEPKVKETIKKLIPNIDNLKYIHKNYFNKKVLKHKLFLDKNLYKIEEGNLSIYFLAKSFIYLKTKQINGKFNDFLKNHYLPLLSDNIYILYTKMNIFYRNKIIAKFPLYSHTKKFIETYMILNPKNYQKYDEFFFTDISVILKEENNISYCYSSRLVHDFKKKINPLRKTINSAIIDKDSLSRNDFLLINQTNSDTESISGITRATTENTIKPITDKNLPIIQNKNFIYTNNPRYLTCSVDELNSSKTLDFLKISEKEEYDYYNSFELIKKGKIINNPKNYFFKIIFSEIYKNIIFQDKAFKIIKSTYLTIYRDYKNVNLDTKQTNYPIIQKNFSNSLEPKIFMRRDFRFYDEKFLNVSHSYIKFDALIKKFENIYLYPHKFIIKEENEPLKFLDCELVTAQYITFGKMYFLESYIFFESEKEDPRYNNSNIYVFIKYAISNRRNDNKSISKQKSILIYFEDIKEVIQRRTLLSNQSIEIFHKNGKSYFFNFFRTENVKNAYYYFNEINKTLLKKKLPSFIFNTNNNEEDIKKICQSFHKGKSSNYQYLLYLNKYSTRTYNDLTQYPVFPWLVKQNEDILDILTKLQKNELNQNNYLNYLRDMKYPISMQNEEKRNEAKMKYLLDANNSNFPFHLGTHYSTEAFVFYYLMRNNPYGNNLIKLQNYKNEDPNRTFNDFNEIKEILFVSNDNREIIPDFFCYFDYYCNLNCCFYGLRTGNDIPFIDDFQINSDLSKYNNNISSYVKSIFECKTLLNNLFISNILSKWVDNIFGRKQIPKKELIPECCNIYNKLAYEQKVNFENKIMKNYNLYKNKQLTEKAFKDKIQAKISFVLNLGMNAKQILDETITYEGKNKVFEPFYKSSKSNEDKILYFNRINNDNYLVLKDIKKNKMKTRVAIICDKTLKEKDNKRFDCKSMNLMKYKNKAKFEKIKNFQLYRIEYGFTYLYLYFDKTTKLVFLSCRYLENYFRIQYHHQIINTIYEDFVTCIKGRDTSEKGDDTFYTGLLNGKLTEWKIIPYLNSSNKKNKSKSKYNFTVKELKSVYAHKSSITAIEIYRKQNIIITAGEDKFIYIRKIFDFELLTVIDLTYSFGNPIISETNDIFPSLIKISDLNLLYVLLYDYDSKMTIIRGYNLNGLFFAQTDPLYFKDQKINLLFNNISFTKNENLIVGFYNSTKFYVLKAFNLQPLWIKNIKKDEDKSQKLGTKMIEHSNNNSEFYILYDDDEYAIMTLKEKKEIKDFDTF